MKPWIKTIYHFFPVQLFILHFRKYQVLLLFWYILFSTINSGFLKSYGADALFFVPEYLGEVNISGAIITGVAMGVFIMSWNITTFIMHTKRFRFLATTAHSFLKYSINNGLLPLIFIVFYMVRLYQFDEYKELMTTGAILSLMAGILLGYILLIVISFAYFFGAGRTISGHMAAIISNPELFNKRFAGKPMVLNGFGLKVNYFLTESLRLRKIRNVSHYREDYIDAVFKRHHIAAILSILLALGFLILVGFMLDNPYFEMPAAASIFIFFSLMVAVIGSLSYFLESWSLPVAIILLVVLNFLFKEEILDPRNKAYGLNYHAQTATPAYTKESLNDLCDSIHIRQDRENMLAILETWKKKQTSDKPTMVFINVSGGGLRSSAFVMNTLQHLDSMMDGRLMQHTFLISGASGGMLSATYYRELYRKKLKDSGVDLYDKKYDEKITGDLLNPIFTSLMARDLLASNQKFTVNGQEYIKDRGYAFERKLGRNTDGLLDITLKEFAEDEKNAKVPLIFFSPVIKRDSRKLLISTQPISFMMKPHALQGDTINSPDAVDFSALFKAQGPLNLRLLTALRMNATFPYVLPNVWLPSKPIIDVMDAGLRDNYGQEISLRFIDNFKEWILKNTGGVIILQIRDRNIDNWQEPFETTSATDVIVTPATMLQHNWFKIQDYSQDNNFAYFKENLDTLLQKVTIVYLPEKADTKVALNFHLTAREKSEIFQSLKNKKTEMILQEFAKSVKP